MLWITFNHAERLVFFSVTHNTNGNERRNNFVYPLTRKKEQVFGPIFLDSQFLISYRIAVVSSPLP